jgi:hypothetical protein
VVSLRSIQRAANERLTSEVSVSDAEDDEGEGGQAGRGAHASDHDDVNEGLASEDTDLELVEGWSRSAPRVRPRRGANFETTHVVRLAVEYVGRSDLSSETHGGEGGGDHDDPKNLNGREREDREAVVVLERKADQESQSLHDVTGQQVKAELSNVIDCEMEAPRVSWGSARDEREEESVDVHMRRPSSMALRMEAKLSSVRTMSEALERSQGGQHRSSRRRGKEIRDSLLGDITTVLSHGNTNIGTLERGTIVDSISGCRKRGSGEGQRLIKAERASGKSENSLMAQNALRRWRASTMRTLV